MRKEYELNKEQVDSLVEASEPVPYTLFGGHEFASAQENANKAWFYLGREMGFKYLTVRPVKGKGVSFFTAEES